MPDKDGRVIYDGSPMWVKMVAWVLLGVGGIVMVPIGLINRAWWLLVLAVPLLLAGLVLSQVRLRIVVEYPTGVVRVTNSLVGLQLRQRGYPPSDVVGLDIQRVAGAERERPSDAWYLKLRLRTRTHTVGKYDDRASALRARRELNAALRGRPQVPAAEMRAAASARLRDRPESADGHYQLGLALLRSGDTAGARRAFQKALALAREPLLRRMIEQRLGELDMR
jgi:tetratricopeptide (TPR) repeat protein